MSEIITKGYLLNQSDFEIFDEIITFINEHGNIFSCIALGVKKIKSKNARHLKMGSLLEFNFFMSRSFEKIGKLKKVVSLDESTFNFSTNHALLILNQLYFIGKPTNHNSFKNYVYCLKLIKNLNDIDICLVQIFLNFINLNGIYLEFDKCVNCHSKKIYNFSESKMGFVCYECNNEKIKISSNVIKIIYLVYKKKYDYAKKFKNIDKLSTIKLLSFLINNLLGINLYNMVTN